MKRISLTAWIFIGMAAGVLLGVFAPGFAKQLGPLSAIFLRLIRSHCRAADLRHAGGGHRRQRRREEHGTHRRQGDPLFRNRHHAGAVPGIGRREPGPARRGRSARAHRGRRGFRKRSHDRRSFVEHIVPASLIDAMARNDVLQIVVFAFLFGASCAAIGAKAAPVVTFCQSLAEVMFQFTKYVMYLAPLGVGAAIAVTVGSKGIGVLFGLSKLIAHNVRRRGALHFAGAVAGYSAVSHSRRRSSIARFASRQ